jgi:hypothetical protein
MPSSLRKVEGTAFNFPVSSDNVILFATAVILWNTELSKGKAPFLQDFYILYTIYVLHLSTDSILKGFQN